MHHLFNRATMAHALTLDLDPQLKQLLTARFTALPDELADYTEYLVIEAGDTEADIVRAVGFTPLIEPIDGIRFGEPGFWPWWDALIDHDGWYEMIVTFGGTFACILLHQRNELDRNDLSAMCLHYVTA